MMVRLGLVYPSAFPIQKKPETKTDGGLSNLEDLLASAS
jgi:hypothetical protein